MSHLKLSHKNLTIQHSDLDSTPSDLINAEEFEHIAEIYDTIRMITSKVNPHRDSQLAQDFDDRLKHVMEDLSDTVNDARINGSKKKDRSLKSKC